VNESRSVFVPDGNAPRDSLPAMLIRRAVWAMGQSLPVLPKTSDIKPSAIRLAITHSVTSDRQATKIDTAWNALFRELGSTFRVAAERHNRKRRENATIPIAKGPRYWHSVEADGFAYRWFSGHEKSALSEAWRKLWQPLAGGRKVEAFTERLPWDPLGLSLYVSPKESSKLGKWYIDRLLPAIEELCAHKF
jgi:hypothetical protein